MSDETFGNKIFLSTRRIWGITSTTALDWIRSGPALFFTFIYPVVMILLFGYIFGAGTDDSLYTLYYLNEDVFQIGDQIYSNNPANLLLENLGLDNETLSNALNLRLVEAEFSNTTQPSEWMKANDIPYLFIIPSGWSAAVNESKVMLQHQQLILNIIMILHM